STDGREQLRAAAQAVDKARRRGGDEGISMWKALVEGRWSLIDRFDSDGRRYFIARKNDPEIRGLAKLTERERQVVGYAALGHSNKLIAYELGLALPTVANHLTEACTKLGLRSRAELIQAYAALAGS